jgi:hypothetical protein
MKKELAHKLNDISHLLCGVDPSNKFQFFWYNFKTTVTHAIPYQVRNFYYYHIRTIWNPQHSRIRKVIPKHWMDLDYVIQTVNFEIIKSFYEDEYDKGIVDWDGSGKQVQAFAQWLTKAYQYITVERPELERKLSDSYPTEPTPNRNYEELYGQVDYYEKLIEEKDTKVLVQLMKYRSFMWT